LLGLAFLDKTFSVHPVLRAWDVTPLVFCRAFIPLFKITTARTMAFLPRSLAGDALAVTLDFFFCAHGWRLFAGFGTFVVERVLFGPSGGRSWLLRCAVLM